MSDMSIQISERVIASEERARQSHPDGDCFDFQPRNEVGYGAPALGIGASCRAARKARPAGERPNDKALKTKRKFNGVK